MRGNRQAASLVAAVMGALVLAPIQSPMAFAAIEAKTSNVLTLSSGTLRVFATSNQTFVSPGIELSTPVSNGTARNFFVNNGGTLGVSRFTMTITLPNNSNVSTFRRCPVNVSFTGTNTCASGSPTTLTNPTSGAATSYLLALSGSDFYSFQIVQNKTGTMSVSTSSSLSHVSGAATNS